MLIKIEELDKSANNKSSRLTDKNRKKIENLVKNARSFYNFRNKIIDDIEKEIGKKSKKIKERERTEGLKLHRAEEELTELIKNIQEDDDSDKDNNIKPKKNSLLNLLSKIKNKEINDKSNGKSNYLKFFDYKESLGKTNNNSRADRIKNFINDAEYIIFGPLFNPLQEIKNLDTATGGEDIPKEEKTIPPTRPNSPTEEGEELLKYIKNHQDQNQNHQ